MLYDVLLELKPSVWVKNKSFFFFGGYRQNG